MKIIFISLLFMTLLACSSDSKDAIIDRFAPLSIRGVEATKAIGIDSVMNTLTKSFQFTFIDSTGLERYRTLGVDHNYWETANSVRDTINKRFMFAGGDVIYVDPSDVSQLGGLMFVTDMLFISALDSLGNTLCPRTTDEEKFFRTLQFWGGSMDTIGYIPNKVLKDAQDAIVEAFNAEDYETCYELFDNAMIFIPTTSAEYRRLKAEGIE